MNSDNCITTSTCDICDQKASGVMFHTAGVPHFFACAACWPNQYAPLAQEQIDAWLAGGLAMQSYVLTPESLRSAEASAAMG